MGIKWDNEAAKTKTTGGIDVTIRTGKSQAYCNLLTRLQMQNRHDLLREIMAFDTKLTVMPRAEGDCPNIPEIAVYIHDDTAGTGFNVRVAFVWGIVLLDAKQRRGDFRFVVILESELEAVLSSVFDLERTLTPVA